MRPSGLGLAAGLESPPEDRCVSRLLSAHSIRQSSQFAGVNIAGTGALLLLAQIAHRSAQASAVRPEMIRQAGLRISVYLNSESRAGV